MIKGKCTVCGNVKWLNHAGKCPICIVKKDNDIKLSNSQSNVAICEEEDGEID